MNFTWSNTSMMGAGTKLAPLLHACRFDQRFSYYVYLPQGFDPVKQPAENLLVVIHGTFRDAESTKNAFVPYAERTNSVILAPLFPTGIEDAEDIHNYKFIKYHDIRFDEVVLHMIEEVEEAFALHPKRVMLYGFSGGGQFVHRFLYLHPDLLHSVVIGSPGRITYLDPDEDWYAGIRDFAQQFGKPLDFEALKKPKILLLVGADDTESVDVTGDTSSAAAADKFGSNRVERLQALYANYQDHGMDVTFEVLDGVAHEEEKVTATAARFFVQAISEEEDYHE